MANPARGLEREREARAREERVVMMMSGC